MIHLHFSTCTAIPRIEQDRLNAYFLSLPETKRTKAVVEKLLTEPPTELRTYDEIVVLTVFRLHADRKIDLKVTNHCCNGEMKTLDVDENSMPVQPVCCDFFDEHFKILYHTGFINNILHDA